MKPHLALASLLLTAPLARAALSIPSDGSDGTFAPAVNTEIDLSQAITGNWDASNAANPGKGRYDANKWAVVFKYSSVNIPAGVTVTFKNHPTHAPVVWLVSGSVNIAGTVNLRGKDGTANAIAALTPAEPGPGGFRGGAMGPSGVGSGYGIGGSITAGPATYQTTYGNPQIIPLIGGSGSTKGFQDANSGSGAGGAILIGAALNAVITGTIDARGGMNGNTTWPASSSGGAIRLIAEQVTGNGNLIAVDTNMAPGRIRVETPSISPSLIINPNTVAVPPASPPQLWPGATAPTCSIISIGGVASPADPTAPVAATSDVAIATNNTVEVLVQTTNFPTAGVVEVRDVKKYGPATWTTATLVGGSTFASGTWRVNLTFAGGFTTLQAKATVP